MIIDLRSETLDIKTYLARLIENYARKSPQYPSFIHFGYYFDQNGWMVAYFDGRENATMDGEWSKHLKSSTILPRPDWYNASELADLNNLKIIAIDGREVPEWLERPDLRTFALVLGNFIKSSVLTFDDQGLFRPLIGDQTLKFCVEELTGLYTWPINTSLLNELSG